MKEKVANLLCKPLMDSSIKLKQIFDVYEIMNSISQNPETLTYYPIFLPTKITFYPNVSKFNPIIHTYSNPDFTSDTKNQFRNYGTNN